MRNCDKCFFKAHFLQFHLQNDAILGGDSLKDIWSNVGDWQAQLQERESTVELMNVASTPGGDVGMLDVGAANGLEDGDEAMEGVDEAN